jgi:hypothetical protein
VRGRSGVLEAEPRLTIRQQEHQRQRRHVNRAVQVPEVVFGLQIRQLPHPRRNGPRRVFQQCAQTRAIGDHALAVNLEYFANAQPRVRAGKIREDDVVRLQRPFLFGAPRRRVGGRPLGTDALNVVLLGDQHGKALMVIGRVPCGAAENGLQAGLVRPGDSRTSPTPGEAQRKQPCYTGHEQDPRSLLSFTHCSWAPVSCLLTEALSPCQCALRYISV